MFFLTSIDHFVRSFSSSEEFPFCVLSLVRPLLPRIPKRVLPSISWQDLPLIPNFSYVKLMCSSFILRFLILIYWISLLSFSGKPVHFFLENVLPYSLNRLVRFFLIFWPISLLYPIIDSSTSSSSTRTCSSFHSLTKFSDFSSFARNILPSSFDSSFARNILPPSFDSSFVMNILPSSFDFSFFFSHSLVDSSTSSLCIGNCCFFHHLFGESISP